jgi:hypothetical protein
MGRRWYAPSRPVTIVPADMVTMVVVLIFDTMRKAGLVLGTEKGDDFCALCGDPVGCDEGARWQR